MKGPYLDLCVFYKENQIIKPLNFVMDFCNMWDTAGFEPFKLHKRRTLIPAAEITEDCFAGGRGFRKGLLLKSSLKRDHDDVIFMFEIPGEKRITDPDYIGYQEPASSIAISIPFEKTRANSNYNFDRLFQIFLRLLSYGAVENASVSLGMSDFQWEVDEQLSRVLKEKNAIIRKIRLDWATFFTTYQHQKILQGFINANSSLEMFCEQNGLEILMADEFDGIILKVKEPMDDTPDYFCAMLRRTQEFYSILETNG
jgi:hypothetical protein